ncbi:U3-containing 90S pre-ribosomal complex subunit-domain containing protein [Lactarius akahatsu]|uniref:U3-containing 90S pre-ribosomal complex subunit-domain containing protein n=1 Tax=Lactarius akahatsu TaxID=416441 RepID=A0AAD4LTH8_9AGAM|nr:U3-containing 90S pre-ribosomal complex subunit-domain containing protein [Lactarius akahatsu]
MAHHRGDDLDDDFMPDETVALSEDEGFASLGDHDDIGKLLSADEDEVDPPKERPNSLLEKKRRRREKEKERRAKEGDHPSVASRSPAIMSEYLSAMQAKSFSKMSALELQDRQIQENFIVDTTTWTGSRSLDTLADFITQAVPNLHTRLLQRTKSFGAPTLLFLTGAALRAVDVTRALKNKTLQGEKSAGVAKLFAKHCKLEEHINLLKKTKIGSAVGTPGRVGKLLCETDALSVSALTHIVLDVSHRDAKELCLLDIHQTRDEVFRTVLGAPQVMERIKAGKTHIVLF